MTAAEKTSAKKIRGFTIALIILCVVFVAAIIGATAYLTSLTVARGVASTSTLEYGVVAIIIVIVIIGAVLAMLMTRSTRSSRA